MLELRERPEGAPTQQAKDQRFRALARFFLLGILWVVLGMVAGLYTLHAYAELTKGHIEDFHIFYSGDVAFFRTGTLYVPALTAQLGGSNNNSPVGALFFIPLIHVPLRLAAQLWAAGSLVAFACGVWLVWRVYRPPRQRHWQMALLTFMYVAIPFRESLYLGTWGFLVAFFDIATWSLARRGADRRAGAILGLALALRWQPVVLLLFFVVMRRWRVVGVAVLTAALCAALALCVFGWRSFLAFAHIVIERTRWELAPQDGSLHAFWGRLFTAFWPVDLHRDMAAFVVWLAFTLVVLVVALWRSRMASFDVGFSLCIVCGLLVVPSSWTHYYVALLLPMIVATHRSRWLALTTMPLWFLRNEFVPFDVLAHPVLAGTLTTVSLCSLLIYYVLWIPRAIDDSGGVAAVGG